MFYRIEIGYKSNLIDFNKTKKMIVFETISNNINDAKLEIIDEIKNTNIVLIRIMNPMKEYNGTHNNDNSLEVYLNFINKLKKITKENKLKKAIEKKRATIKKYIISLLVTISSLIAATYINTKIEYQMFALSIYGVIIISIIIISAIFIPAIKKYDGLIKKIKIIKGDN